MLMRQNGSLHALKECSWEIFISKFKIIIYGLNSSLVGVVPLYYVLKDVVIKSENSDNCSSDFEIAALYSRDDVGFI
ncbi:hypothetical protein Loa_02617 [Legionella oakridgensis ATCC 33761 = DSM 21215]|uniref:Uncharacterized protein n=2 Tax=Legionella oakridgensis TaxID=29423 RepID=W0BIA4_9GAMM|nr:hypothetical protein Loa_02617 [Legionella oakridgensis ATCC 33761 = DSM 21215]ETO92366.1 hypothetical protein LOR_77c22210 [Legionella oakridgensis RV-2-2007]KTD37281.1 hypothetical protein Loak_2417 [Legionella oakridgensis]STY21121.1 Uncharacterised protein [Legionella longbeachae]